MCLLLSVWLTAEAERLPLNAYTTADGLAHNVINKIVRDSRGFLWFCTSEGLSRFDGYSFTNYGTNEGLPHPIVRDILETRDRAYWVATYGGLCKFNPQGVPARRVAYADDTSPDAPQNPMFMVFTPAGDDRSARAFTTLLEGRDGTIWCGTWQGLLRVARSVGRVELSPVDIGLPTESAEQRVINALVEDRHGTLWIGTSSGLYRRRPEGSAARYGQREGLPNAIHDLLEDRHGNLWVGTPAGGLLRLVAGAGHEPPTVTRSYGDKNGLRIDWAFDLCESSDGRLWVGTNNGLVEFLPDEEKQDSPAHVYTKRSGFSYHEIMNVAEDRDGNLCLGTVNGAMKLARSGFITYDERDGIYLVKSLFESAAGEVYAYGYLLGDKRASVFEGGKVDILNPGFVQYWFGLGHFDGQRFTWLTSGVWGGNSYTDRPFIIQARTGEWWFGQKTGLYLFPRVSSFAELKTARPVAIYTTKDGLAAPVVYSLYEDSRGDLWVSTIGSSGNGLARWERATRTVRDMAQTEGLPSLKEKLPAVFAEDGAGNIWVGFNQGGLARYAANRFTVFTPDDGLPPGGINDLHLDQAGRLWVATSRGGLSRIDEPAAARPAFVNFSTGEGLSSNSVTALTEDLYGRIYAGTGRGVDQITPATARIKHFTTADGLAPGEIFTAIRDRSGALWFGTRQGLSRFVPEPEQTSQPPPVLINGLRLAREKQSVSALGETEILLPELAPDRNQLQIDFVGLSFAPGETLRYQYRLEGADAGWSAPTEQRTINFASLAPGRYRFLVRAVNSDGVASPTPAAVTFTVLPPLWQRWWFLSLAALVVGLAVYALYRYRVARLVELERVRTRIASDLHDDIGAGL